MYLAGLLIPATETRAASGQQAWIRDRRRNSGIPIRDVQSLHNEHRAAIRIGDRGCRFAKGDPMCPFVGYRD